MNESIIHLLFFCSVHLYIITFFSIDKLFKESPFQFPKKNGILTLTPSSLEEAFKTYQNLAILMYYPYCNHYKQIISNLEISAKSNIVNNINLTFGKIDISHYSSISEKYKIKGISKLIFFVNGNEKEIYNIENNNKDFIIEWFYKRIINPVHLIDSINDINEYQKKGEFIFVYFGNNENKINFFKNFSLTKDIKFGLYQNLENIKEFGIIQPEDAVLFKPFDEPSYVITSNITKENLERIIKDNKYPLIYKNVEELYFYSINNYSPSFFFIRNSTDINYNQYDEAIKNIALKYKEIIKFSIGDINDNFTLNIINISNINLNKENFPSAFIFDYEGSKLNIWKYNDYFDDYNETNLEAFIYSWLNKELKKFKSEEEPGEQERGKVFKIVYKTFKKEVLNNKLNVFVKFYIPNDTLCKEIEPIYKKLAAELKINGNIRIAEYNLEKNYFDYIKIEHYPTLILFRAGHKDKTELMEYKGDKNVNDMIYFVLINQAFPILNEKEDKQKEKIKIKVNNNGDL